MADLEQSHSYERLTGTGQQPHGPPEAGDGAVIMLRKKTNKTSFVFVS